MLYPSQQKIVDMAKPNWMYALGTSSGKSLIALAHWKQYANGEPILIVQPPSKLKSGEWAEEVERFADYHNIDIEYEQLSIGMLAKKYQEYHGYFLILDEAHLCKNPTSKRGKAAIALSRQSTHFVLLTATPGATYEDFMAYMIMFGYYKNKTQYLREHAVYGDLHLGKRTVKVIQDWRNTQTLDKRFDSFAIKLPTEYFVDLPKSSEKFIHFKKSSIYNKAKKERVIEVDGEEVILDTPMKLMQSLRYLTNQKDKLAYIKEFLENTEENTVIFYNFKRERDDLVDIADQLDKTIYEVNGSNFSLPPMDERLNNNTVSICQYQSSSEAINLSHASQVIYMTPTYSYLNYKQSLGRCIRHKGKPHVAIYKFITKGTVEADVWRALDSKKDFDEKLYMEEVLV